MKRYLILLLLLGACIKKKQYSSSSGGGPEGGPAVSYTGQWTAQIHSTGQTGTCGGSVTVSVNVLSSGYMTFSGGSKSGQGTMVPTTGAFSGVISDAQCGNGQFKGTCPQPNSCTGDYQQGTYVHPNPQPDGSMGSEE